MALALRCTVEELRSKMSVAEEQDWKRFFKIFGPVGEQRMDLHFAYLRWTLAEQSGGKTTLGDHMLQFDYRNHFPKDAVTQIERMIENADADVDKIMALGKRLHNG